MAENLSFFTGRVYNWKVAHSHYILDAQWSHPASRVLRTYKRGLKQGIMQSNLYFRKMNGKKMDKWVRKHK